MTPLRASPGLEAEFGACEAIAREGDRDRWLASLLYPCPGRGVALAIYAFSHEIARIRETTSQPVLGEIRLAWWRDALMGQRAQEARDHPIARALLAGMTAMRLPAQPLLDLIEARRFDLYDDPMPDAATLEGYCAETCSILFRMGAIALAQGADPGGADACGHGGLAYGLTGLLRAAPWHAAQGRCYLPQDILASHGASREGFLAGRWSPELAGVFAALGAVARGHWRAAMAERGAMSRVARPILASLGLVPLYLDAMARPGFNPFASPVDAPQWRKQWALWRAAR